MTDTSAKAVKKVAAKKAVAKATEPTRRKRSLTEKATEALRIADDRVAALKERGDRLKEDLDMVTQEHALAVKRRDYLALDPALESVDSTAVVPTGGADQ